MIINWIIINCVIINCIIKNCVIINCVIINSWWLFLLVGLGDKKDHLVLISIWFLDYKAYESRDTEVLDDILGYKS